MVAGGQIPTVFVATPYTPPIAGVAGWTLVRWGGSNPTATRRVAVNADAENTSGAVGWNINTWTTMSRTFLEGANQPLRGSLKQMIVTDTYLSNADAQHAQVLAYIKSRYPTLVTY